MKEAEIREFELTPHDVVQFGLGSSVAIKRWAKFKFHTAGDLYWIDGRNIRKDEDKTDEHTSIHKDGNIFLTRRVNGVNVRSRFLGNIYANAGQAMEITHGQELLEPGYLYYGLKTIEEEDKTTQLIECLDDMLVNSRLYYSLDIFSQMGIEKITEYYAGLSQPFCVDDQRSHLYIFVCGKITLAVTMRFTEGNQPIDLQMVREADSHSHKLKRLYFEDNLKLSEKCSLSPSVSESGESLS